MHLLSPDRRRRLTRRRSQQRVPRTGPASLGDGDEASADRAFDRLQAGQGHQVGAAQLTVQRDRQEHRALVVGQVPDPEAEDVGHLAGDSQRLPGIGDAALQQRPADLEDEERVAARLLMDQPQHAGGST